MIGKQRVSTTGFTLTEFLVLIGVGSLLAGLLLADLTQTKTKFFQQACAGNLKQWGLAINLYAQDYGGTYYGMNSAGVGWDDSMSPYVKYLTVSNSVAALRMTRACPFIASLFTQDQIISNAADGGEKAGHNYTMPDPQAKFGTGIGGTIYRQATGLAAPVSSPFRVPNANGTLVDLPSLKAVPNPSTFLLLMDGGNAMHCGGLLSSATHYPSTGPHIFPSDRHGGNVNCLFGDFHVELVSTQALAAVDATGGCAGSSTGNPWFNLN